jgi:ABC-type Fe3+/spermidine/putrescine transport system ATPase subunit
MSDQIAVMEGGRVVQLGASRDIYFRPRTAFVAAFVGAANLFPGEIEAGGSTGCAVARLTDGTVLRRAAEGSPGAGGRVVVSVRPESMSVQPEGSVQENGWNRITGTVVSTGFLGSVSRCGVAVGGQTVQAMGSPHSAVNVGDRVALCFSPDAAVAMPG